jgi:transcriptional regulator
MYTPPAFRLTDLPEIHAAIAAARLATLVTATAEGLMATPLPLYLVAEEGEHGTLYGHVARANPQWSHAPVGAAMALFGGPHAYVSPSWYAEKPVHGRVVPTWNYQAIHAHGPVEFFDDAERLLDVVTRLTAIHESGRPAPWAVSDAPADYIAGMLRGIVGLRLPIARIEAKRKMSQNRPAADRAAVAAGLAASGRDSDRETAGLVAGG